MPSKGIPSPDMPRPTIGKSRGSQPLLSGGTCDRTGDVSNPRIITPNGYVWKLEAEAVRVEKPEVAKGGASKPETTLDKRTQQACNAAILVRAARIISEKLELGSEGDELALTEVLHSAERAVNELFGEIHTTAEAAAS